MPDTSTGERPPTAVPRPGPVRPVSALPGGGHPAVPGTAVDVVAQVQALLTRARSLPVDEHVAAYDEVHGLLQQELARLDEG